MGEIQIFNNPEFGDVRTMDVDGEVWFVASDVAKALGYTKPANAIAAHCRYTLKRGIPHPQGKGTMEVNTIPEGDLYRLVAKSELPAAEKFESWVFDEVLPAIRKTGRYSAPLTLEQQMAQGLLAAQKVLAEKEAQITEMKPKAIFADAVATSKSSILIGDLAKILKANGIETGQKRLFQWMRDNSYLIKSGSSKNMPTQRAMELKLFEVKETTINNPDGSIRVTKTTKVTGKGQQYFVNKFLKAD